VGAERNDIAPAGTDARAPVRARPGTTSRSSNRLTSNGAHCRASACSRIPRPAPACPLGDASARCAARPLADA